MNNPFFIRYSTIISKGEYKVPHRTTISKKIIDEIYEEILKEIVSFANSSSHLAITCDGWTDKNVTHFWSITLSGVNEKLEIGSKVLSLIPMYEDFSANYIGNIIKEVLSDSKIDIKKIQA